MSRNYVLLIARSKCSLQSVNLSIQIMDNVVNEFQLQIEDSVYVGLDTSTEPSKNETQHIHHSANEDGNLHIIVIIILAIVLGISIILNIICFRVRSLTCKGYGLANTNAVV